MDHHGLLALTRALTLNLQQAHRERVEGPANWTWALTPVIYPESRCPYCHNVTRSPGIWCLSYNSEQWRLMGAFFPKAGGKLELIQPSHPHDTGGGYLCLGSNRDGVALLSSVPNIHDAPMGRYSIPKWLKKYWDHSCPQGLRLLSSSEALKPYLEEYLKI